MNALEVNFDGLVGPTHNYSGLSFGNLASGRNVHRVSNPREAAKQGLRKMKTLFDMGVPQGVLPPQERPAVATLRRLGFGGTDEMVIDKASRDAPQIFRACCSASSMWTANAATVSPSADADDKRVHFTPANLCDQFHRSIEAETTARVLRAVFSGADYFVHHAPLPGGPLLGDEGAANHTRFCKDYGDPGVELFVYGRQNSESAVPRPLRYPARQTLEASQAVSRLHQLDPTRVVFAQQSPAVIDAGVFHNDVISAGNRNVFFYHQDAFLHSVQLLDEISQKFGDSPFHFVEVKRQDVTVKESVDTYLFNSQLLSLPSGGMALVLPEQCRASATVWRYLQQVLDDDNPIEKLEVFDLNQSMRNGGGPACLRLRVVLNEAERRGVNRHAMFSDSLVERLNAWVDRHYRDRLVATDLADRQLLDESRGALDELTQIMGLGSVYPFQYGG
jgi:succinylarginine dihydrolase